jgi:hypothetical protein
MNKLVAVVIGGVLVVGIGAAVISRRNDNRNPKVTGSSSQNQNVTLGSQAYVTVEACSVLTEAAAKQVLGEGAVKGDTGAANASSNDISVTNCSYTVKPVATGLALEQLQNSEAVSLLVRAARTKAGVDSNKAVFGKQKPAGVEDVAGYGDRAYFNPAVGQLDILKGNNWYILSHYIGTSPTKATLAEAKELADAVKSNLK